MKKQTKKRHKMTERQEKKKSIRRKKHLEILLRKFKPVYMYSIWEKTETPIGEKWQWWDEHGYCGSSIYLSPKFEPSNYADDDEFEQTVAMTRPIQNWPVTFTGRDELIMRKFELEPVKGFYYGLHWSEEEIRLMQELRRPPHVFNQIKPKDNRIILQQPESPDADRRKLRQYNERVSRILEETNLKIII